MSKELENAWEVQEIRQNKCKELEEENKKLKDRITKLENEAMKDIQCESALSYEIKKLKKKISRLESDLIIYKNQY